MKNLILFFCSVVMFTGCFAPVNSLHDTAKLLEKDEIQVKGNFSSYYNYTNGFAETNNINTNYGLSVATHLADGVDIGFRYEAINVRDGNLVTDIEEPLLVNFLEGRTKIRLIEDRIALELPLSLYFTGEGAFQYSFDPRLYLTYRPNKHIDFTIVPKVNFLYGVGGCLLYTSPSPRDATLSRMPSSA